MRLQKIFCNAATYANVGYNERLIAGVLFLCRFDRICTPGCGSLRQIEMRIDSVKAICGESVDMPIYEYRCDECGSQKEHLQKMSDAPVASCPSCGSAKYSKLLSAAGFQLKGSGWYATDFKNSCPAVSSGGHSCDGACGCT